MLGDAAGPPLSQIDENVAENERDLLGQRAADNAQQPVRDGSAKRADELSQSLPEPLQCIAGRSHLLGGRRTIGRMSLELQGKGGNELRVGTKWIECGLVGTGLEISDSGLERLEFLRAQCLGGVAPVRRAFDLRRQARLEGEVDG